MPINTVSNAPASTALSNVVQKTNGTQTLGQDAFLQLLVTQLTNQDPTAPQDQSQFLAQLAQFSTVQGVSNISTSQSHLQAAEMLGKTVSASVVNNNLPQLVTGKVTSVRWDTTGVHLGLDSTTADITLDQISKITN